METLTYELELILAEEREGLDFLRAEVTRLEEDKAQLEGRVEDMALAQQLIVVGEYLMSETRALKPLSPTATEFGEKYDCPLKLPGLRMLGTNPQEDEDFNCTHALVKSHGLDRAIALASTPEFASKISELRAQYEEFCKAYPELELCTSLAGAVTHLTAVLEGIDGTAVVGRTLRARAMVRERGYIVRFLRQAGHASGDHLGEFARVFLQV